MTLPCGYGLAGLPQGIISHCGRATSILNIHISHIPRAQKVLNQYLLNMSGNVSYTYQHVDDLMNTPIENATDSENCFKTIWIVKGNKVGIL